MKIKDKNKNLNDKYQSQIFISNKLLTGFDYNGHFLKDRNQTFVMFYLKEIYYILQAALSICFIYENYINIYLN